MLTPSIRAFEASTPAPGTPPREPEPPKDVEFTYNPQDRVVMEPGTTVVKQVAEGPKTERFHLGVELKPNKDGKYVFEAGSDEATGAVSFSAANKALALFEAAYGGKVDWAFRGDVLTVNPDSQDREWLNAYYSRNEESVNFFHERDRITNTTTRSGHSGEIVAHEVGHAILDGLRPGYLWSWGPDVGGFHESFGDMMAILLNLQDERSLARFMAQTDGNMRKPSILTGMAEELGRGINDKLGANRTGGDLIRQAVNSFKWADPDTLPERGGPDRLGREAHDFSRLWTGAFYEVLCDIADKKKEEGLDAKAAARAAGEEGIKLLANLMKEAPQGEFTYRQMAEAFVRSDNQHNGGKWAATLQKVYTDREILPKPDQAGILAEDPVPPSSSYRMVSTTLSGPEFGQYAGARVQVPVDNGFPLGKDAEMARRTQGNMKHLIAEGRVKWTNPGERITDADLFDANGQPYVGVVRWENGQMEIERVKILS